MRKILLLAILAGIFFINTPEAHPELIPHIEIAYEEINRAVQPLYTHAVEHIDYQNVPITILVNGQPVETSALAFEPVLLRGDKSIKVSTDLEDFSLRAGCSLTGEQWDAVLREYNSPAVGTGEHAYKECQRTNIDNAYVLGIFIHESTAGTAQNWAGIKPDGTTTANIGNIVCAGYPTCYGRFRDYQGNWNLGFSQTFDLLRCYRDSTPDCSGLWIGNTVSDINQAINRWAPREDSNNPESYAAHVRTLTVEWRKANQTLVAAEQETTARIESSFIPNGNPLNNSGARITQGYGVGSHAPAEVWGGIDLAIGSHDESMGKPVYATHNGTITAYPNSGVGGNCVAIINEEYRTMYCHLDTISVVSGQNISRGNQIGTMGNTGNSTGAHLHYEVWHEDVNVNPEGYNILASLE